MESQMAMLAPDQSIPTFDQQEKIASLSEIVETLKDEVKKVKLSEENLRARLLVNSRNPENFKETSEKRQTTIITGAEEVNVTAAMTNEEVEVLRKSNSEFGDQLKTKDEELKQNTTMLEELREKFLSLIQENERLRSIKPKKEIILLKTKLKTSEDEKKKAFQKANNGRQRVAELEETIKVLRKRIKSSKAERENDKLKNDANLRKVMNEVETLRNMVTKVKKCCPMANKEEDIEKLHLEKFTETLKKEIKQHMAVSAELEENLKAQLEITSEQQTKIGKQDESTIELKRQLQELLKENAKLKQQVKHEQKRVIKAELAEDSIQDNLKSILTIAEEKQALIFKLQKDKESAYSQIQNMKRLIFDLKNKTRTTPTNSNRETIGFNQKAKDQIHTLKEATGNERKHPANA